ncbi:hypothetical protein F5Y15DRAFT_419451 [Xylariaceae sp. FL0016]|nr:hypothetical protein F5Y15DRAFT_419451 [Xylariaceae sp. FL0016]
MSSQDIPSFLPLESLDLSTFPRTTHNLAWSPDAELAVACDDCVYLFVPDFTAISGPSSARRLPATTQRQFSDAALRFPVAPLKSMQLNRHLFDVLGAEYPDAGDGYEGAGKGVVTAKGSSMNHAVALEWSPAGLGRMRRSVLVVLTGAGMLTVYCQGAPGSGYKVTSGSRSVKPWIAAWCVGGGMRVPAMKGHGAFLGHEHITAFAWARDTGTNGAVLAYMNDADEIVILTIQSRHITEASAGDPGQWKVQEVARFVAEGPHPQTDVHDPDYRPSGSSFALSWGPWLARGNSKTSMLSYAGKDYIGFRQITVGFTMGMTGALVVQVSPVNTGGVCVHLGPDAFVTWEDLIWTVSNSKVCRGIIATPAKTQAFQLPFDDFSSIAPHSTDKCDCTYPSLDDSLQAQNPITGLVIHPPSLSQTTPMPLFTSVRLSATHDITNWHQSNLPLPPNPEDPSAVGPRWAHEISQTIEHQLPRALARDTTAKGDKTYGFDDEEDEEEFFSDDAEDREGGSDSDVEDPGKTNFLGIKGVDTSDQVHVNRIRIWGIASSPGGGVSAVFVGVHRNVAPERDVFSGMKCRVLFGRHTRSGGGADGESEIVVPRDLSTEARMWEWLYGGGPPVPGISAPSTNGDHRDERDALKDHFDLIARQQVCVFCKGQLTKENKLSRCEKGHLFENCAATGLSILAPGITNTCGVCGYKCLKQQQLVSMAPQLERIIEDEIPAELCGGCGGKFLN